MFLLTNDDGIDAPGLAALERVVAKLGTTTVVAPLEHLSGCSHRATTGRPLVLAPCGERRYHLDGMPADCTRVGLTHIVPDVEWVVSGINEGGNLGADVYMSGTVAAVREAALHGKRGMAFSQYIRRDMAVDWDQAALWTARVLDWLMEQPWPDGRYVSVNLPHLESGAMMPSIVQCPLDSNPLPVRYEERDGQLHYRGNYHARRRNPGSDVEICFSGQIAVTWLSVGA